MDDIIIYVGLCSAMIVLFIMIMGCLIHNHITELREDIHDMEFKIKRDLISLASMIMDNTRPITVRPEHDYCGGQKKH